MVFFIRFKNVQFIKTMYKRTTSLYYFHALEIFIFFRKSNKLKCNFEAVSFVKCKSYLYDFSGFALSFVFKRI
jgi:hypothetical protein